MNTHIIHLIDGPVGAIETASTLCDIKKPMPDYGLLLLHPHPLHGGTMDNKVVTTLGRAARDVGLATVAFNFRGVGRSQGKWDHGHGELDDAFAVASLMFSQGVSNLCLAGFSFGGSIAAYLIPLLAKSFPDLTLVDLIQVAPAVENFPIEVACSRQVPRTVLFNSDDEVVSPNAIQAYADDVEAHIIRSNLGGHFYHGQLTRLKTEIVAHYQRRGIL